MSMSKQNPWNNFQYHFNKDRTCFKQNSIGLTYIYQATSSGHSTFGYKASKYTNRCAILPPVVHSRREWIQVLQGTPELALRCADYTRPLLGDVMLMPAHSTGFAAFHMCCAALQFEPRYINVPNKTPSSTNDSHTPGGRENDEE